MSDLQDATDPQVSPLFDASGLDAQFQRINSIEKSWALPALPDQVKLDLLSTPALDANTTGGLLWHINGQYNQAAAAPQTPLQTLGGAIPTQQALGPQPVGVDQGQLAQQLALPAEFQPADDVQNQVRRLWHGVAGLNAPEIVTDNAVTDVKKRAVSDGLLPADTKLDGSWTPELSHVQNQLAYNDLRRKISGDRTGSISTSSALDLLNKWTSPDGLVSAATALNFLPDIGAFKSHVKEGGPLGFFKAAVDLALPVVNDLLLFTGVSEIVAFGRAAQLGAEGVKGIEAANDIAKGGSVLGRILGGLDSTGAAAEVAGFQRPGMIASRLVKADNPLLSKAGDLSGWRQATSTVMAKKAIQQGMKLGVVGQVESYLPGQDALSARIEQRKQALYSNPIGGPLAMALSLPLAPPHIFQRGAFTEPASKLVDWARNFTTAVPQNTALMAVYHEILKTHLQGDDLTKYMQVARQDSPGAAIVALLGNGDAQRAGEMVTHLTMTAALNRAAENAVTALGISRSDGRWDDAFHLYRNNYINKLRPVGPLDLTNADDVERFAEMRSNTEWHDFQNKENRPGVSEGQRLRAGIADQVRSDLLSDDPAVRSKAIDDAQDAIQHHNTTVRDAMLGFLLHDLDPAHVASHVSQVFDRVNPSQWNDFTGSIRRLEELDAVGDIKFVDARQPGDWQPGSFVDQMPAWLDPKDLRNYKALTAFGGNPDPLRGHFTPMRLSELTRQDAAGVVGYGRTLQERLASLRQTEGELDSRFEQVKPILAKIAGSEDVTDESVNAGLQALSSIRPSDLRSAVKDFNSDVTAHGKIPSKFAGDYLDTLRWVARQGGDPAQAIDHIQSQISALDKASFWGNPNIAVGDMPFNLKLDRLEGRLPHIAAGVQVPDDVAADLAAKGYKAVYGTDFLFPHDLVGLNGPFGDLQRSHLKRLALGRFLSVQDPNISMLRDAAFRNRLVGMPEDVRPAYAYGDTEHAWAPDSADVNDIVSTLHKKRDEIELAAKTADQQRAGGIIGNTATALQNAVQPKSIFDFNAKTVHELFGEVYGERGATHILNSLKQSRSLGWEYEGLGAIESRLRANSWTRGALKVFGKTDTAESLGEFNNFKRLGVGALSGALALAHGANLPTAAAVGGTGAALYGEPTPLRRALTGTALAGGAALAGGDLPTILGAGAIGATAGSTNSLANPRVATGLLTAGAVGRAAQAGGASDPVALALGIGAGVAGVKGLGVASRKALDLYGSHNWAEYSKLGEGLAQLRDRMRFSLNPMFDLRRMVKSAFRGSITDLPEGVTMPINHSLGRFSAKEQAEYLSRFDAVAHPWHDADAIDEMTRFSADRGILGFSPSRDMAGMFGHLVRQGVDDATASDIVRKALTYGGRTGLEKSVNFAFFPFSFEKKVMGQFAQFLSHDLGRTVVLHDAVKAYDVLNDRYDLNDKLRDHLPILQDLQKLNMFTNGISPGELGGVNRPILEAIQASPIAGAIDPVLNAFLPQGLQIDSGTDTADLQRIVSRMVPAYRDIEGLLKDTAQQGHVLFSSSHMTDNAEVSNAYESWDGFKKQVVDALPQGVTWDKVMRSPQYRGLKLYIQQKRAEIGDRYPAWEDARVQASANADRLQDELTDIVAKPTTPAEEEMAQFHEFVTKIDSAVRKQTGVSFRDDPESAPTEFYNAVRSVALAMARQGNGFEALYQRYYEPIFGPIQETI